MGRDNAPPVSTQEEIVVFNGKLAPAFRRFAMPPNCTEYHEGKGGALDHVVASASRQEEAATARVTRYCAVAAYVDITGPMPTAAQRLSDHCPVVVDIHGRSAGPVRYLYLYVASELHARVEQAATAAGVKIVPWLRHMVRQVTMADFPASWREATPEERSHESRIYAERFTLRPSDPSQTELQQLVKQFGTSKAEIIRQLIAQTTPEDFPRSWHMQTVESRAQHARPSGTQRPQKPTS